MDEFKQMKLSKTEWVSIEKKLDNNELLIMNIIKNGYDNVLIQYNGHLTLNQCIKIDNVQSNYYIYMFIIKPILKKKYKTLDLVELKQPKIKLNNADKIRIQNIQNIDDTIEFIILDNYNKLIKHNKVIYYYNLVYLFKNYDVNMYLKEVIVPCINAFGYKPTDILIRCNKVIENNAIFDYKPIKLHSHQAEIYVTIKRNERFLIFYTAPTSSGKTITPIGICQKYKVIFICASRHIGVNLAKSAINVGVKTAFAFGCSSKDDIRLHYFSVNSYTNDKYKKPIHSDGSKLELIISDIHSYEHTMNYMLSFFDKEQIVLFWDEPTISMDHAEHPLHEPLSNIWRINTIPRLILSSATLPNNLGPIKQAFKDKFKDSVFYKIETTEQHGNIILMDDLNNIIMPHNYFNNINDVINFVKTKGESYLKFLSVCECANYIMCSSFKSEFDTTQFDEIDSYKIKLFYYKIIQLELFKTSNSTNYDNSTLFTTTSAANITHGPAIWLVDDIEYYINGLISQMNIQSSVLINLEKNILFNLNLTDKLNKLKKDYQDKIAKDEGHLNKMTNQRFTPEVMLLIKQIEQLEASFKLIQLDPLYIPNTYEHFTRWTNQSNYNSSNVFKGNLNDHYVNRIMDTQVEFKYKVLLLLGIGILHKNDAVFNDIMKELADSKNLMLILAASDYIYGTNYQFAHGYLSNDLKGLTQEKIIQAIGRVGRKEKNKSFTFRFMDNSCTPLFFDDTPSIEGNKMNELFT